MDCEPPRGTGQPFACAASAKTQGRAAGGDAAERGDGVGGEARRTGPRALSSRKRRVSQRRRAAARRSPKRAQRYGSRGSAVPAEVRRKSAASVSHLAEERRDQPAVRARVARARATWRSPRPSGRARRRCRPGRGGPCGSSGCSHSRPCRVQRHRREGGRADAERVHGGARVVPEAGEGQLLGAGAAADRVPAPRRPPRRSRGGPVRRRRSARWAPPPPRPRPSIDGTVGLLLAVEARRTSRTERSAQPAAAAAPAIRRAVAASRAAVNGSALPPAMRNGSPASVHSRRPPRRPGAAPPRGPRRPPS